MRTLIAPAALLALLVVLPAVPSSAGERSGLRAQLEERTDVRRAMLLRTEPPVGLFQCGVRVLGRDPRTIYAWLSCGDYRTGPRAELLSGSALPAVVRTDGRGHVVRVRFPRQQSLREDIRRMFPTRLQDRVIAGDIATRPSPGQLLDAARSQAAPRR